ncbi:uncharacterized protein LOC125896005 isoform X2 [Epinephelus fuscoguttatus]|uniref:uncharacterized protein LOC125896005 isoform X2 n=1 Tax=Epinephelus fuscoguttatus TaxID=293821 RepID=UPI0020D15D16|nr:uncharacterized protein LOC125896005 isoform X2 [Epinephelus fuscoguttatus]
MEMWLTRSTLVVLLTAAAAAAVLVISGQAPVILDDNIREEKVPSGSTLTFHCRLRTETHSRLRVVWYFKRSLVNDSHTVLHTEMVNKSARTSTVASNLKDEGRDTEGTLSVYTLSNATEENSGWYFCKVIIEIPSLTEKWSHGTEVVISKSIEHTTYLSRPIATAKQATVSPTDGPPIIDLWMWIILGVSAFILIVLLVTCVCLRRRRRRNRGEDPVYANTRRQPSPRPGMDNLKTVPSSQHLRNPSPSTTYDDGKRRYKHRKCDGTSKTSKPAHHHHV